MDYLNIEVAVETGVGLITLNRPERRNAMSFDLLGELDDALAVLGGRGDVRVIVLDAAGVVFSAGHDLNEMVGRQAEFYDKLFGRCTEVMLAVQATPQPVIAKVRGLATAAGCQLVAACDLAIAAEDAWFATPGVRIGLFCSTPMVPITRAIGRKRALQMLLTGEPIDAATALSWGLVNRVVSLRELDSAVDELVAQISRFSGEVIAIGKDAFYRQIDQPQRAAYEIAGPIMSGNAQHADAQEGMSAFLEKREPDWGSQK